MKKLFLLLMFSFLFFPKTSQAFDQRCWIKEDCDNYRASFGNVEAEEGFYSAAKNSDAKSICKTDENGKDVLGRDIGLCLPVGKSLTNISFGGRNEFTNIGDFLKFFYQYGFVVASVVAVIIIIVSGIMYIYSGGNSDTVGQAKKKIFGAIIGLVLLAFAYTLLNNINPYLVNLRMPGIWAINTMGIAPARCEQLDKNLKVGLATTPTTAVPYDQTEWFLPNASTPTLCANQYFVDKLGEQMCTGNTCTTPGELCYQKISEGIPSCNKATIAGTAYSSNLVTNLIQGDDLSRAVSSIFGDGWAWQWINQPSLVVICKTGEHKELSNDSNNPNNSAFVNYNEMKQQYVVTYNTNNIDSDIMSACNTLENFRGFALQMDFNEAADSGDEEHFLGIDRINNIAIDIGKNENIEDITRLFKIYKKDCVNEHLLTKDEIKKGININIDVSKVCDIETGDEGEQGFKTCYDKIGYSTKPEDCKK